MQSLIIVSGKVHSRWPAVKCHYAESTKTERTNIQCTDTEKGSVHIFLHFCFLLQLHIVAVGWCNDEHGGDGGCNINTIYRLFVRNKLFYVHILFCEIVQISTVSIPNYLVARIECMMYKTRTAVLYQQCLPSPKTRKHTPKYAVLRPMTKMREVTHYDHKN